MACPGSFNLRPKTATMKFTKSLIFYLFVTNLFPGIWALFFPSSFYTDFPGFGRHWVAVDGPYNQHLTRDVGAFFCAISILNLLSLIYFERVSILLAATATLVFSFFHFWYHMCHLHMYSAWIDKILNIVVLSGGTIVPGLLLFFLYRTAKRKSAL
jgi:hypothetical protein